MQILDNTYEFITPDYTGLTNKEIYEAMIKHIEICARTCYKSGDKSTGDFNSAEEFVKKRLIDTEHTAMLEHGGIYLVVPNNSDIAKFYKTNKFSKVNFVNGKAYVSTNYRVIYENNRLNTDFEYFCQPCKHHDLRITLRYRSCIHFYKDTTRHRVMSWAIESTRFCLYLRERFGHSISFSKPIWLKDEERDEFEEDLKIIESIYFKWVEKHNWTAQQAAYFLIQGTSAEIIHSGYVSDFKHFFNLRTSILKTTGAPHPTVSELIDGVYNDFIEKGYIEKCHKC